MKLVLIGFGVVGQGLAEILRDKAADLKNEHGFETQIVGVSTRSRGTLYHPDGLELDALLSAAKDSSFADYPDGAGLRRDLDTIQLIEQANAYVMVESTLTNFDDAQPALDHARAAFRSGKHVVMANKGPIALAYDELTQLAARAGKLLRFEATVMGGTPSLRLGMQALAGCHISEARGILNGTTNYILTQMEGGMSYPLALAQAQKLGYAEADPAGDVDGWDAAGKAIILAAALFGKRLTLNDMDVQGISAITSEVVEAARAAGERWKLIARVSPEGGSVRPMRLPISNPLAGVSGATNAVTYVTDLLGDVTLVGPGAGRLQTGFGLLSDLLEISRYSTQ